MDETDSKRGDQNPVLPDLWSILFITYNASSCLRLALGGFLNISVSKSSSQVPHRLIVTTEST